MKRVIILVAGLLMMTTTTTESYADEYSDRVQIEVERLGDGVYGVRAEMEVDAPLDVFWNTLTDYEKLNDFIPNMSSSMVVREKEGVKYVEQTGSSKILFFQRTETVILAMYEKYPTEITFHIESGNFDVYKGKWEVTSPTETTSKLVYSSEINPSFFAPGFVLKYLQKRDLPISLGAIAKEAVRRAKNRN